MNNTMVWGPWPHWLPVLCSAVHRWEILHGSLEGFGETRQKVRQQFEIGSLSEITFRDAPDFELSIGPEVVKVKVVDGTSMEIRRWSAQTKAKKHHRVPRMLISRWGSGDGRVVWRRSDWEADRCVRMKPEKVMRESDAYAINAGLHPHLAEELLSMLEGGMVEILQAIDDLLARPVDSRPVEWSNSLAEAQPILKLFIVHQLIRTRNGRKRAERAVPFQEYVKAFGEPDVVKKGKMPMLRRCYEAQMTIASSIVDPDSPFYKWASGSETEVFIGLPDPLDDVFPLTDDPVVVFPFSTGLSGDPLRPWWEGTLLFLPISPRAGIGIKPVHAPRNFVKWTSISVEMVQLWCAGLVARHSEVVLPSKKTWVWNLFNVGT